MASDICFLHELKQYIVEYIQMSRVILIQLQSEYLTGAIFGSYIGCSPFSLLSHSISNQPNPNLNSNPALTLVLQRMTEVRKWTCPHIFWFVQFKLPARPRSLVKECYIKHSSDVSTYHWRRHSYRVAGSSWWWWCGWSSACCCCCCCYWCRCRSWHPVTWLDFHCVIFLVVGTSTTSPRQCQLTPSIDVTCSPWQTALNFSLPRAFVSSCDNYWISVTDS